MTSIELLQVTGIRSFNPDPSQAQQVQFQKPLTVILGKNGAGKTTVIEALLNACTGAMPPGSGGAEKSSFVYDPKVMGESEVKAQIRLVFTGKDGRNMQVIRSMQVTRTRNKRELKTLDNTVAYHDPATGKVVSNTYRASDVDRVVPELLGVSPSVLKYVVFCHQEESNWPLMPPKDVKEIFDDLFAATRYVATLEKLRKVSQEKRKQLKEYETSLFALREHRTQAKELEESIAKKEEHIKTIESRKTELEPALKELRHAAASLDAVEQQSDALAREAAQIAGRMDQKRETIQRANLPPSHHTLEQMQEAKANLVAEAQRAEATVVKTSKTLEAARDVTRRREQEQFSLKAQLEALEREEQQHKRNVAELRELLHHMRGLPHDATNAGPHEGTVGGQDSGVFVLGEDSVDERSLNRVLEAARKAAARAREAVQSGTQGVAAEIAKEEERRHHILRSMDADKKESEMTEAMLSATTQRLHEARAALQSLGPDANAERLQEVRAEVERLQRRAEAAEEVRKKGEHAQRRERIHKEFNEQNTVVATLRQAMMVASKREQQAGDVEAFRTRIEELRTKLEEGVKGEVVPALTRLDMDVDERSTFASVLARTAEVRRQKEELLRQVREAHAVYDRQAAALEQRHTNLQDQLARFHAEVEEKSVACAASLRALAQSQAEEVATAGAATPTLDQYEALLEEARTASEASVQKRHALEAMAACYSDFAAAAKASNSCAVCERPFADHTELHRFIQKTEERQMASPKAVEAAQLASAQCHERVRVLEEMQHTVQDVRRLRAMIPAAEEELAVVEADIERAVAKRRETEGDLDAVTVVLERLTEVSYKLQSLKPLDDELSTLKVRLAARERQLAEEARMQAEKSATQVSAEHADKSYQQLTEEYEAATAKMHQLNEQLAEVQRMEDGSGSSAAERALVERQRAMYQLEMAHEKASDLQRQLSTLNEEHQTHRAALQALESRRTEHNKALEAVTTRLQQLGEQRRRSEAAYAKEAAEAEARLRQLEAATPQVLRYIKEGKSRALQSARDRLREAESAVQQGTKEVETLAADIRAAQKVVAEHHVRMSDADRVISVLELTQSLEADQAHLKDVEAALKALKGAKLANVEKLLGEAAQNESLPKLRELIREKMSEVEKAQAQQQGSVETMLQDVATLKQQLSMEKYAKIEKRYRSTFLKAQSEALTLKDADNYYAALEVGVQAYHKEKIEQINQIISELWRQTYRGSDIDTIEIRSETESTSSTASKRSYTYRVVIRRGDSELDMRGRCSAGQKVLASIIIRLALNETFCYDCGILALDEPTTNLDEDNARSLAESLRSLIEIKRNVKNFQLVVITHDEQFVRALGGHHLDHFHYVHKDRDGAFSVIEKRTFNQLFS